MGTMFFAKKDTGLTGSNLHVQYNLVSKTEIADNADVETDNNKVANDVLEDPHAEADRGDYNLNTFGVAEGGGIVPSIFDTGTIDSAIPNQLEKDFYNNVRSEVAEGGPDAADSGAIEVNYLDREKSFEDPVQSPIAHLSPQGRNALARSSTGLLKFRLKSLLVGKGGYNYGNPIEPLEVEFQSNNAKSWIEFLNNDLDDNDIISIKGHLVNSITLRPTDGSNSDDENNNIYFYIIGNDVYETAINLADKINNTAILSPDVYAIAENERVIICAVPYGSVGNSIFVYVDGDSITGEYGQDSGGSLVGGIDEIYTLIDQIGGEILVEDSNVTVNQINYQQTALAVSLKITPDMTDYHFAMGEAALVCEVLESIHDSEVGTEFTLAVSHSPIITCNDKNILVRRFVIQF